MSALLIELRMSTTVMDGLKDMGHNGVNWKQSWRVWADDLAAGLRRELLIDMAHGRNGTVFRLSVCLSVSLSRHPSTHATYLSNILWAGMLLYWILTRLWFLWKHSALRKLATQRNTNIGNNRATQRKTKGIFTFQIQIYHLKSSHFIRICMIGSSECKKCSHIDFALGSSWLCFWY